MKKTIYNFWFVFYLIYLEIVFRLYMHLNFDHFIITILFSLSTAFFISIFTCLSEKHKTIIISIINFCLSLVYSAEVVLFKTTSTYYQIVSSIPTLFENHIFSDYNSIVLKGIFVSLPGILLLFLPFVIYLIIFKKPKDSVSLFIPFVLLFLISHSFALISCDFLYKNSNLKELYNSDTNIKSQIENFGLLTMLRLDTQHCLFGTKEDLSKPIIIPEETLSTEPTFPEENVPEETIPEIKKEYNKLDLEFSQSSDEKIVWLNEYFKGIQPTLKNKYTGMFKNYNVIFITAEGFSGYMIDPEITPTLYKLTHEGFVFNNFYTPLHYTSTTNGECQNLLSLYPKNGEPKTMSFIGKNKLYMPFSLANQLNQLGYNSLGYHFNSNMYGRRNSHTQIGYNWNDSDQLSLEKNKYGNNVWPQSDKYMFEQTIDKYIDSQPFNVYYMSISGHMPYSREGNTMTYRNWNLVENLKYSDQTKSYIAANLELEKGLTYLIETLEEKGIADNTLIIMAPDHIPYFDLAVLEELANTKFGDSKKLEYLDESSLNFDVYKNSLIVWSKSIKEPIIVDKICGQVDILPTISNLLGLNYDSRLLIGQDILSEKEGLVIFSSGSWISDKGLYNAINKEFTPFIENIPSNYVENTNIAVQYKLKTTTLIMETNYFSTLKGLK